MVVVPAFLCCLLILMPHLHGVSAFHTCEAYTDASGTHHESQYCGSFSYCCGTCENRFCCGDIFRSMGSIEQDRCNSLNPGTIFICIFVAMVFIMTVIFICVCCRKCPLYGMYGRRYTVIHWLPWNQRAAPLGPQPAPTYPAPAAHPPYPAPAAHPPYPAGPPAQTMAYPAPKPIPGGYSFPTGPAIPPSAPLAQGPYSAPGQPPPAYPPPGEMAYSQPPFAPGHPEYPSQPQAAPPTNVLGPPPPYSY